MRKKTGWESLGAIMSPTMIAPEFLSSIIEGGVEDPEVLHDEVEKPTDLSVEKPH